MIYPKQLLIAALLLSVAPALAVDPPQKPVPTGPVAKPKINVGDMLKKLFSFTTPSERSEAFLPPIYAFKSPTTGAYVSQLSGVVAHPSTPKVMLNSLISLIERQFGLLTKGKGELALAFRKKITLFLSIPHTGQNIAGATWKHKGERTRRNFATAARVGTDGSFATGLVRVPASAKPGDMVEYGLYEDSKRSWTGFTRVHLIQPTGWTIVSDIDDTIRNTGVLSALAAFKSTFVEKYNAVPNMVSALNTLVKKLSTRGSPAALHYLSGSPIALLPALQQWIAAEGLPAGPMQLQKITLNSLQNAKRMKQIVEYKVGYLNSVVRDFPKRRFVFIGDSTQTDPESYATVYRSMTQKGLKAPCIYIREATGVNAKKEAKNNKPERYLWDFRDVNADHWMIYKDANELKLVDPTSGSCYPKGKKNPYVSNTDAHKLTKPAVGKDNKPVQFKLTDSKFGSVEFESIYEVLYPYYAKFAGMFQ